MSASREHHRLTIERYDGRSFLSEVEPRLSTSIVVPIAGELAYGNIFRQLRMMARMDTEPETFEVLYVINNTEDDAREQRERFVQNQQLRSVLSYASGYTNDVPTGLLPADLQVLEECRERHIRIRWMDKSTKGLPQKDGGDNIEIARTYGEREADFRLKQTNQKKGVIVALDADVVTSRSFLKDIVQRFDADPHTVMIRLYYDVRPGEGGEGVLQTSPTERLRHAARGCTEMLRGGTYKFWYAIRSEKLPFMVPDIATPQLRDGMVPFVGTVKPIALDTMITQDRAREEGGVFGSARHLEVKAGHARAYTMHPVLDGFAENIEKRLRAKAMPDDVLAFLADHLCALYVGSQSTDETSFARVFIDLQRRRELEASLRTFRGGGYRFVEASEVMHVVRDFLEGMLSDAPEERDALGAYVRERIRFERILHAQRIGRVRGVCKRVTTISSDVPLIPEIIAGGVHNETYGVLVRNPWLVDVLNTERASIVLRKGSADAASLFTRLQQRYPEYLSPFSKGLAAYKTAYLRGCMRFMGAVYQDPVRFPVMARVLGVRAQNGTP